MRAFQRALQIQWALHPKTVMLWTIFLFFFMNALTAAAQYKLHVKFKRAEAQRLVETALTHHCTASYETLAKHYLKGNTDRPKRKLIKLQSSAV